MNEQQKIQYIAHTISPTILNSIITNVFSFFLNTCQRSTEYLSRAKGKKYRTSEASTGDFLPFALDKYSVLRWQVFRKKEKTLVMMLFKIVGLMVWAIY